jgi:hypothetical protein
MAVTTSVIIFIIGFTESFIDENEESRPVSMVFKLSRGFNADEIILPIEPNCPENVSALSPIDFKP